jgi:hypothetical protein
VRHRTGGRTITREAFNVRCSRRRPAMKIHDHAVEDGEVELQSDGEIVETDPEWSPGEPEPEEPSDELLSVRDEEEA